MSDVVSNSDIEGNSSCNLDETLPCKPSQDELDLRKYVRIVQHKEKEEEKETQVFNSEEVKKNLQCDDSKERRTDLDKKGSKRSCTRKQEYRPENEIHQTIRETKRLSNDGKTIADPEQEILLFDNENISGGAKSDAKRRRNVLSKSLPSSQIKKERTRRTSDSNQEINKQKDIYTSTLTAEAILRRKINREKRNKKDEYSTRSSTSDVTEIASTVLELPYDQLENSPVRVQSVDTVLNPDDVSKTSTTKKYTSTSGAKMSNNTNEAVTFHKSHTYPSIMPSKNISKGDRKSDSVICGNHLASEAYMSECSNDIPGPFTIKQKSEKCETHQNKNISFFCEQHSCLCCTECKQGDHMNCANQPLDDLLIRMPAILELKQNISKASKHKLISLRELRNKLIEDEDTEAKERDELIEDIKKKSSRMMEHKETRRRLH